ncbi:MAG: hypothetical protein GY940_21525, partial [bacterium]|nr:hypothetical protein [bacterium]
DFFTLQTGSPMQIKMYNAMNASVMTIIDDLEKKSFDFQAEKYLEQLIKQFQKAFPKEKPYIHLKGETRKEKPRREKEGEEETIKPELKREKEEEDYDSTVYDPLDEYIRQWLREDKTNLLVILGEYGTGKTSFLQHVANQLATQHPGVGEGIHDDKRVSDAWDQERRLPLYFPLRGFDKDMERYIVSQLNNDGIEDINYPEFRERMEQNQLILLLDGFD